MPAAECQPFLGCAAPYLERRWVTMCMRVGLSQRKNGLLSALALSMSRREVADFVVHGFHRLG